MVVSYKKNQVYLSKPLYFCIQSYGCIYMPNANFLFIPMHQQRMLLPSHFFRKAKLYWSYIMFIEMSSSILIVAENPFDLSEGKAGLQVFYWAFESGSSGSHYFLRQYLLANVSLVSVFLTRKCIFSTKFLLEEIKFTYLLRFILNQKRAYFHRHNLCKLPTIPFGEIGSTQRHFTEDCQRKS